MIKEILEKCSSLTVHEKRNVTDEYADLVFYNNDIDEWGKILSEELGPAVKKAGERPASEDAHLTKEYGGVRKDQTLFKKDFDNGTVVAMFWPWQSEKYTTLKIFLLKG